MASGLAGRRILVTSAGSGASNNLVRSLRAAEPSLVLIGCHDDPFALKASLADRNHLVSAPAHPRVGASLMRVIAREGIDLVIPNSDDDVQMVSRLRRRLPCRVFLPRHHVIRRCRDKYALTAFLGARGLPVAATEPVPGLGAVRAIRSRLSAHRLLWCRMRTGAGSMGATVVRTAAQARSWIAYWGALRGVPARAFTVSEYLPGRDFACQSVWKDGEPVLIKTVERLSYFGGASRPSGTSSVAALARSVDEPLVADLCIRALRALDRRASGAFSVDLKANARGVPCITEINAGRFITMLELFDRAGKHHMSLTYVRLALDEPVDIGEPYDAADGHYLIRDVDTPPAIFHGDELFDGVEDARR